MAKRPIASNAASGAISFKLSIMSTDQNDDRRDQTNSTANPAKGNLGMELNFEPLNSPPINQFNAATIKSRTVAFGANRPIGASRKMTPPNTASAKFIFLVCGIMCGRITSR